MHKEAHKQEKQEIDEQKKVVLEKSTPSTNDLANNWQAQQEENGYTYYWNKLTGESQWEVQLRRAAIKLMAINILQNQSLSTQNISAEAEKDNQRDKEEHSKKKKNIELTTEEIIEGHQRLKSQVDISSIKSCR